ncbi:hypothetical protein HanRHA438_Chr15g0707541 [Helianthus annuus]|nr:hypothetical protein HanRHA438_Chr15g0707541 [Helianthus annuus]
MLGKRGELNLHHFESYNILGRVGNVTYKLGLPDALDNVHDVIYVSNLRQCLSDETPVIPLLESEDNDK